MPSLVKFITTVFICSDVFFVATQVVTITTLAADKHLCLFQRHRRLLLCTFYYSVVKFTIERIEIKKNQMKVMTTVVKVAMYKCGETLKKPLVIVTNQKLKLKLE